MAFHPRDLIANAEKAMDTYRQPDIGECEEFLESILVASGLSGPNPGSLERLTIREGEVCSRYEWSVRGCLQSDDYSFPEMILDASDPIHAAKLWGLEKKVTEAGWKVAEERRSLDWAEKELSKAQAALAEFTGITNPPPAARMMGENL